MVIRLKESINRMLCKPGREIRVIVKPEEVDDLSSFKIAREIKEKIESECNIQERLKLRLFVKREHKKKLSRKASFLLFNSISYSIINNRKGV